MLVSLYSAIKVMHGPINISSVYIHIYVLRRQTGRQKVTERMLAGIPGIQSALNFALHAILIC